VAPPQITVRYWGGAARAAGSADETLQASTIGEVREVLAQRPALVSLSRIASFLVDGVRAGDDTVLTDGTQVDVLPPFAGG
jgi:molybdopterin synthase sulfur carrier subunit